jgi:hypothetical protein
VRCGVSRDKLSKSACSKQAGSLSTQAGIERLLLAFRAECMALPDAAIRGRLVLLDVNGCAGRKRPPLAILPDSLAGWLHTGVRSWWQNPKTGAHNILIQSLYAS